ncbi:hypothetical protein PanWU01x14_183430 [Parasponia andersonii]|uniref:Uncharacterized protein n=1 Tax=Parasponia andersonii TaxID=3476 RepID=A0A2P5C566_PARAD|nr:hypothetical protein PanWU01x14_183430 [Parasponia andersonii]
MTFHFLEVSTFSFPFDDDEGMLSGILDFAMDPRVESGAGGDTVSGEDGSEVEGVAARRSGRTDGGVRERGSLWKQTASNQVLGSPKLLPIKFLNRKDVDFVYLYELFPGKSGPFLIVCDDIRVRSK